MENNEFQPTVSIVIPVRNGEATIGALLESLQKLDYDQNKVEVIVVDGKSTDKTREIVAKYPVKLCIEDGEGLNAARNTGIKNSGGELIAFTDSDCIVPSNWIRKMVENFRDPQVWCVGGNIRGCEDDFLSRYADNTLMPVMRSFKKRQVLSMIKLFFNYPAGCNMAFRRKAIEEAGYFDEGLRYGADDLELVERVCKAGHKIVLDPNVLVLHKHRSTLKGLLKQTFNYGRGGVLLLKRKKTRDVFSTWHLLSLLGFAAGLSLIATLIFFAITTCFQIFSLILLGIVLTPLLALMGVYASRARKNRVHESIIAYPFLDFLRVLAFCAGEVYQLFK
jgi:cellulose synthase/poly-beta-1,6-N-acetylglucosamine synthase-like glycosyltransferase